MKDFFLALFIFVCSILTPAALTGRFQAQDFYRWDSLWYESMVDRGYISSIPPKPQRKDDSNVSGFPAYPKLATFLQSITGLNTTWSLIAVSWIFNILFWYLLIQGLRNLRLQSYELYLSLLAIWSFPTSFFLSAAYTESIFLSLLLIYLHSSSTIQQLIAGLGLGLTRIVGMPLTIAFLAKSYVENKLSRKALLISATPILGTLSFFLYTEIKFGMWNLYFQMANMGWNVKPNYFFFLEEQTWWGPVTSPLAGTEIIHTDMFSWNVTFMMSWILLGSVLFLLAKSLLEKKILKAGLPYLLCAGILYFVPAAGFYNLRFQAMSRYLFPAFVCWLLWFLATNQAKKSTLWIWIVTGFFIIWGLPLKLSLLRLFIEGRWVA